MTLPDTLNIFVITLSDRASRGEYEDLSGPEIVKHIKQHFSDSKFSINVSSKVIPDKAEELKQILIEAKSNQNIIFTTGGTGIGPRDITVDVVKPLLNKEIPGIMELIRVKYGMEKPNALLSRGVAGIIENTLIYTLPGSVKAVREYMHEILKTLEHSIYMQYGVDVHHKK